MPVNKFVVRAATAFTLICVPTLVQGQTLRQALTSAYQESPVLASAVLSIQSAKSQIRAAEGTYYPTIGASADVSARVDFTNPETGPNGQLLPGQASNPDSVRTSTSDSVGLSYNQTIYDNNAGDAAIRAAQASYEAAQFSAVNTEQNVLLNAATAFYNVVSDRRVVAIRQENVGFVEEQLEASRARLELGEGTRLDVSQAESVLAQARAAYEAALNNLRISEANFVRFVGSQPGNLIDNMQLGSLIPASMDSSMAVALDDHPALLASAAQIRAAAFQAEQTAASFGPNLSVAASAGVGGFTQEEVAGNVTVGLSLRVPIYTPGRDPAVEQANIGRVQSELDAFATRDQITEAVRQAWAGYNSATAQIQSATAAVAATQLALEAILDQNELGEATTLNVIDARADVLSTQETLVSAQAQRSIAAFSLVSAIGRLTAEELGLPVTPQTIEADYRPVQAEAKPVSNDAWAGLR